MKKVTVFKNKKMSCFYMPVIILGVIAVSLTAYFVGHVKSEMKQDAANENIYNNNSRQFEKINNENLNSNQTLPASQINEAAEGPEIKSNNEKMNAVIMPDVVDECLPSKFEKFSYEILTSEEKNENISREIIFESSTQYSTLEGITTFRGNNYRDGASYGFADITEEKLVKEWFVPIGYITDSSGINWTGVGWSGQPSIVSWNPDIKKMMNINPEKKGKDDLKEIIYGALDGKIHFLDLDDGKQTRKPINIGFPLKGSISVDPRGYPLLYTGQGIRSNGGKIGSMGFRIFNLIDQKMLLFIDGYDKDAYRRWGAFDSSSLIHSQTDTLLQCGENGILYTVKLNADLNKSQGTLAITPEIIKYRYESPFGKRIGIENSPLGFKNYIYFADNGGLLQCIDLNTLKPLWIRSVTDDTDSTMVLEKTADNEAYLYTACQVDHQGKGGYSYIRKINALSGELAWERKIPCYYDYETNGGALASPVLGKYDIEGQVIFNIAKTGKNNNGSKLISIDTQSGEETWAVDFDFYSWSSPTAVYTKEGKSYLIVCDSGGYMRLFEGTTGNELHKIGLEANIEASPAVYENMIVIGTRGQKIWGIRIY